MYRYMFAAVCWWLSPIVAAQAPVYEHELSGLLPLAVHPVAPPSGVTAGALDTGIMYRDNGRSAADNAPDLAPLAPLLEQLPAGAGVELPGIRLADEYRDALVDFDPQSQEPPANNNGGGCWLSNAHQLSGIELSSPADGGLPESSSLTLTIVCMHASSLQLQPMQAGKSVRAWSASLLGRERSAIELIAELVPGGGAMVDGQFQTIPQGDALHRASLDFRVIAYAGSELAKEYPRRGGRIDAREISLKIQSMPLSR